MRYSVQPRYRIFVRNYGFFNKNFVRTNAWKPH